LHISLGWYVPKYVVSDVPSVLFGDFSPEIAAYFNNSLIVGDPTWVVSEQTMIDQRNFSLNIQMLSGEEELASLLDERYVNKEPILFYFWKPHILSSVYDVIRVQLPDDGKYSNI
jgi:glycine betaine/proline transport system substrate-binding protein